MINNELFILKEIPNLNPLFDKWEYQDFWDTQHRRNIEGLWQSGKWMPGPLHQYVNFYSIPVEDPMGNQVINRPLLRDIDWEYFLIYEEARGFSGFSNDTDFTCNRYLGPDKQRFEELGDILINSGALPKEDLNKTYVPAREYLRKLHSSSMGKPMYLNPAKNVITGQGRGGGKTAAASCIAMNNWMYGGALDYDIMLDNFKNKRYNQSLTIITAHEKNWVSQLQKYILDAHKYFPGEYKEGGIEEVSPLWFPFTGSREIGDKDGLTTGTGSRLISRVFADNPLSTNSGRPNLVLVDEAFFAKHLAEFIGANQGSEASKMKNNMVIWMMGTGGVAKGSSLTYAESIFYDPKAYNCLEFDDIWEGKGKGGKIGYFVPITKTNLLYKDKGNNYITNEEFALKDQQRKRADKASDKRGQELYIVNNPIVPSEMFLITENSRFPSAQIKTQLSELEGNAGKALDLSYKGWFTWNSKNEAAFEEVQDLEPIRTYPFQGTDYQKKGCVEMWRKPFTDDFGIVPKKRYIIGVDVVDKAASTTDSLPSFFVYDRLLQEIVCEYTGRTTQPSFFFEQVRIAAHYYNAMVMYEQNLVSLFIYFNQNKNLGLLADNPKEYRNSTTFVLGENTSKGIQKAGTKIEDTGIDFILDWLYTPISNTTNLNKISTIKSPALLKEMLKYHPGTGNDKVNVDRLSALIMVFCYDNVLNKAKKENKQGEIVNSWHNHQYFRDRGFMKDTDKTINFVKDDDRFTSTEDTSISEK